MHVCVCAGQGERPLGLHHVPSTFLFCCLFEKKRNRSIYSLSNPLCKRLKYPVSCNTTTQTYPPSKKKKNKVPFFLLYFLLIQKIKVLSPIITSSVSLPGAQTLSCCFWKKNNLLSLITSIFMRYLYPKSLFKFIYMLLLHTFLFSMQSPEKCQRRSKRC